MSSNFSVFGVQFLISFLRYFEDKGILVDQSLNSLMRLIPNPLSLNYRLEEVIQTTDKLSSLRVVQVLPLIPPPPIRDLRLSNEAPFLDILKVTNYEVVNIVR